MPEPDPALVPIRVWDLPTRLFHWLLAAVVLGSVVTGQVGGNAITWHVRLGLLAMALLAFRLVWGMVGGRWSRFSSFLHGPGTVLRHLRGRARPEERLEVGHGPLGSLSVWALLAVLLVQVATGLVADDEIATTGPLNRFVATATGLEATAWHTGPGKVLLLVLVALHLGAIAVYAWRGRDLVRPMLHGDKPLPPDTPASLDTPARRGLAALVAAACGGLAWWVHRLGSAF